MAKKRKSKQKQSSTRADLAKKDPEFQNYVQKITQALEAYTVAQGQALGLSEKQAKRDNWFVTSGKYKADFMQAVVVVVPSPPHQYIREQEVDGVKKTLIANSPPLDGFGRRLAFGYSSSDLHHCFDTKAEEGSSVNFRLPGERYARVSAILGVEASAENGVAISAVAGILFNYSSGKPLLKAANYACLLLASKPRRSTHAVAHFEFADGRQNLEYRRLRTKVSSDKFAQILRENVREDGTLSVFVLTKLTAEETTELLEAEQSEHFEESARLNHLLLMKEAAEQPEAKVAVKLEPESRPAIKRELVIKPKLEPEPVAEEPVEQAEPIDEIAVEEQSVEEPVVEETTVEEDVAEEPMVEIAEKAVEPEVETASKPVSETEQEPEPAEEPKAELKSKLVPETKAEEEQVRKTELRPKSETKEEPEPAPEPAPKSAPKSKYRPGRLTYKVPHRAPSWYQLRRGWVEVGGERHLAYDYIGTDGKGPNLTLLLSQYYFEKELTKGKFLPVEERFRIAPAEMFGLELFTDEVAYTPGQLELVPLDENGDLVLGPSADVEVGRTMIEMFGAAGERIHRGKAQTGSGFDEIDPASDFEQVASAAKVEQKTEFEDDWQFAFMLLPHWSRHINAILVQFETDLTEHDLLGLKTYRTVAAEKGQRPRIVRTDLMHRPDLMLDHWHDGDGETPSRVYLVLDLTQAARYGFICQEAVEYFKPAM